MQIDHIIKPAVLVDETATLEDVLRTMVEKKTNSLLVINEAEVLVGEVHIVDILDAIVPSFLDGDSIAAHFASEDMFKQAVVDAAGVEVRQFMNTDFPTVSPDEGLMAVAAIAVSRKKAHIAVIDNEGKPLGLISRRGIKHILGEAIGITDDED